MLTALDHVNLHTDDPDGLADWYERVLGLARGARPPFSTPGVWLYLGDNPVVHLVKVNARPGEANVSLEHFAFRAKGMAAFEATLKTNNIAFERVDLEDVGLDLVQYNVRDPMGTHIHIDFCPSAEEA
ncbi:MAG: VOC family protein [Pseudomonadota bacterium]